MNILQQQYKDLEYCLTNTKKVFYDEKSKFSIHIVCVFWSDQILSFVVSRRVEPSFMDYDIGLVPLSRIGGIIDRCPKQIWKLL